MPVPLLEEVIVMENDVVTVGDADCVMDCVTLLLHECVILLLMEEVDEMELVEETV